jgi:hypothetical protein
MTSRKQNDDPLRLAAELVFIPRPTKGLVDIALDTGDLREHAERTHALMIENNANARACGHRERPVQSVEEMFAAWSKRREEARARLARYLDEVRALLG